MSLRIAKKLSFVLVACGLALGAVGCGSDVKPAKTAKVKPGPMPEGGDWTGVYYSPLFGRLHMVAEGKLVNAKWTRPVKGRWGQLQGNVDGNLLKFDWTEYTDGLVGPNSKSAAKAISSTPGQRARMSTMSSSERWGAVKTKLESIGVPSSSATSNPISIPLVVPVRATSVVAIGTPATSNRASPRRPRSPIRTTAATAPKSTDALRAADDVSGLLAAPAGKSFGRCSVVRDVVVCATAVTRRVTLLATANGRC